MLLLPHQPPGHPPWLLHLSFTSVRQLTDTVGAFIDGWNDHSRPSAWTKNADEILGKIQQAKTKKRLL
jgi:hypothetical protein